MSDDDAVGGETTEPPEPERPMLRVVKGDPTPGEIAALVAVIGARQAAAAAAARDTGPPVRSAWGSPGRALRSRLDVGPGGWRGSGLPR